MASKNSKRPTSTMSNDVCGNCETKAAIKHCDECPTDLCSQCAKGHKRRKLTKGHSLTAIASDNSKSTSDSAKSSLCSKHTNQSFTTFCEDCVQLICETCKSDHTDHSLKPLNNDHKICQDVCTKQIRRLCDDLFEIEELQVALEYDIRHYAEALAMVDEWETKLLLLVKDKAANTRKHLSSVKEERLLQLAHPTKGLVTQIDDINKTYDNLKKMEKATNFSDISTVISKAQALIETLKSYKFGKVPLSNWSDPEEMLPNKDAVQDIKKGLDVMFTIGKFDEADKKPKPVAEWNFTREKGGKDLSEYSENPVNLHNVKYGPGPNDEPEGALCFPETREGSIVVRNPTDVLRFNSEMTYYTHVYVGDNSDGVLFMYSKQGTFVTGHWGPCLGVLKASKLHTNNIGFYDDTGLQEVLKPNNWFKVAFVLDMFSSSFYVNGKLIKCWKTDVEFSKFQKGDIYMGWQPNSTSFALGRVAKAMFFNKALTEQQIQDLN